jgi:hypothetical protein
VCACLLASKWKRSLTKFLKRGNALNMLRPHRDRNFEREIRSCERAHVDMKKSWKVRHYFANNELRWCGHIVRAIDH